MPGITRSQKPQVFGIWCMPGLCEIFIIINRYQIVDTSNSNVYCFDKWNGNER